jgi:hypothetical protein
MTVIPERTWWQLFLNVPDDSYSWTYLMTVIPERTWWKLFLNVPDDSYSWTYMMTVIPTGGEYHTLDSIKTDKDYSETYLGYQF